MQPHLLITPHRCPVPPQPLKPQQFVGVPSADAVSAVQLVHQTAEVLAVDVEVDRIAAGRPIMLSGKKIRQRFQTPVQMAVVAAADAELGRGGGQVQMATRAGLIETARRLDPLVLRWGK